MGNDTFRYHKEHGAVLYKNAEPEELEELECNGWRDNPADADKVDESLEDSTEESVSMEEPETTPEEGSEGSGECFFDKFPGEEPERTEPEGAPTGTAEEEELADEIPFSCGVADCDFVGKSDQSVEQHRRMKHKVE